MPARSARACSSAVSRWAARSRYGRRIVTRGTRRRDRAALRRLSSSGVLARSDGAFSAHAAELFLLVESHFARTPWKRLRGEVAVALRLEYHAKERMPEIAC